MLAERRRNSGANGDEKWRRPANPEIMYFMTRFRASWGPKRRLFPPFSSAKASGNFALIDACVNFAPREGDG